MIQGTEHLNIHIPTTLKEEIKGICTERKAKGMPNATIRFVIIELLQYALKETSIKIQSTPTA